MKRLKTIQCPWNTTLSELVVASFLDAGGYDRHLRHIRQLYALQCARTRQAVVQHFPKSCRVNHPAGGFVLWLEMPVGFDSESFTVDAVAKGISLVAGTLFSPSGGLRNCFRLSCGLRIRVRATHLGGHHHLGETRKQALDGRPITRPRKSPPGGTAGLAWGGHHIIGGGNC